MPDQGQQRAQQPPPAKPVKLRESCDSCLVAKVKCSKQRPLCARCLITGYPCYYGPSSRSGKRRRTGNNEPTSSIPQQTTDASQQTAQQSKENNASTAAVGTQAQIPASSMATEHQSRFAMEDPKSQMHTQNGMHPMMHPANMTLPHVPDNDSLISDGHQLPTPNSPDPCGPWESFVPLSLPEDFLNFIETSPPMSHRGLDLNESAVNSSHNPRNSVSSNSPFEQTTNHHPLHPSPLDMVSLGGPSSNGYHSSNLNSQPSRPLFLPQFHPPLAPPPTPTDATQLHHQNSPPKDVLGQRPNNLPTECDCFAACLATLQTLHNHSWLLSSADDSHAGPPFDSILTINKEAIDRCSRMLGCTKCVSRSGKSIAIMLIGSVFGKVMSLYRAACLMRFGNGNDTGSNGGADGKDGGVKNTTGGGGRLKIQPSAQLAFGAYTVTGEDGRYLEIEILLLDLKRMEVALGAYQERFCSTPVMTNGGGGGGAAGPNGAATPCSGNNEDEAGLYRALTQYFYKNLHYIVQYLKACKSGTSR
ncbi:MAG: hypothetical protein OHK93_006365 [Ramalina farinacea]|uniref:Zn(2)-C6 fungal-type domain-containing protein n=1 Tax=Ramalina farinacea TaxID=258253 RepID=A0AA43TWP3_9LECA|nr:hypothetical protein [Ramalina farinacea]